MFEDMNGLPDHARELVDAGVHAAWNIETHEIAVIFDWVDDRNAPGCLVLSEDNAERLALAIVRSVRNAAREATSRDN